MSNEEILKYANFIYNNGEYLYSKEKSVIVGLLELYQQEKEKKIELEKENEELQYKLKEHISFEGHKQFKELEEKLYIIKNLMKNNLLINDYGIFRPIKNTTKQDIYKTYYTIQELLKIRQFSSYIIKPEIRIYPDQGGTNDSARYY